VRVRLDQLPQKRPALQERAASQVLAVEVEEVESKEHDPLRRCVDGRTEGVKIGDAVLVLKINAAGRNRSSHTPWIKAKWVGVGGTEKGGPS
jgi:hypothetical protein